LLVMTSSLPTPVFEPTVLYISVNQDQSCFVLGTSLGFVVYSCDPLHERFRKDWGMGIGIAEMLLRSNILALVGGGILPKFPKNRIIIWDDYQNRAIAELEFSSEVKAVKIRKEVVVAVLENEVHVYHFNNLNVLASLYGVSSNSTGLCAMSGMGSIVLGLCGIVPGTLHVERIDPTTSRTTALTVQAHKKGISCIGVSPDGTLIVSASSKGTLIRVFDSSTGKLMREFRRGTGAMAITSLTFSLDNTSLMVSSGTGTIHVFDMTAPHPLVCEKGKNRDRSIIRFHTTSPRTISCFGANNNTGVIISDDGKYSKYTYTVENGVRVAHPEVVDFNLFQLGEATISAIDSTSVPVPVEPTD